jgi:Lipocalin-like domain
MALPGKETSQVPGDLRLRLIGVWKLVSWVETPVDGSAERLPLGEQPLGIIIYHPGGYVSAQLMRRDRRPFASGDWSAGTAADYQAEATSYFAYCGPFRADDSSQTVIHSAEVSLFPNWTAQVLRRQVTIDADHLQLNTIDAYVSGGKTVHACMTWKRAETA